MSGPYTERRSARLYVGDGARAPRWATSTTHLLDAWKASGGSLFNQFYDVGGYGPVREWGALEYQDQDPTSSPKYTALVNWIKNNRK